jgi:hypothetical protein
MIAEEETNKETITVLTTDQTIDLTTDQTMVLNKETIDRTTDQTIDLITGLDRTMAQDPTTDQDLIMVPITDRATDPLTDRATGQLIHPQIN